MSCGGRIYKGDTVYVSAPFDVEGYSALTISFFTNGEYKITRTEEEVTIEDGFITAVFEGHDLDVLPDGVLRYTIECEVEGEEYVDSSNTMFYLKTPKDYDADTPEEVYASGYTSGYTDGHASGYTEGYADGYPSGVTDGFALGYPSGVTDGFASGYESGSTDGFNIGYPSGHTDGQAEGYASGYTEGYDSGYTTGRSKGWQDGVDWEYNRISQSAITLSFSGNGEWHKDFFSEVFCNGVVVDVMKGEDLSNYHVGYGFYGTGFFMRDSDGLEDYVASAFCSEARARVVPQNHSIRIDFDDDGYHVVWLALKGKLPANDEMRIYTHSAITMIIASAEYEIEDALNDSETYTETVSTIVDIAPTVPNVFFGTGNYYYPSSRTSPSAQGWTMVPIDDGMMQSIRNLYMY